MLKKKLSDFSNNLTEAIKGIGTGKQLTGEQIQQPVILARTKSSGSKKESSSMQAILNLETTESKKK